MPPGLLTRRNGVQQACESCRKAKIRCDHGIPTCGRCIDRALTCIYHPAPMSKVSHAEDISQNPQEKKRKRLGSRHTISNSGTFDSIHLSPNSTLSPSTVSPLPSLRGPSNRLSLFIQKPHAVYSTTRFSAVFSENWDSLGPELFEPLEQDPDETQSSLTADRNLRNDRDLAVQARIKFGVSILQNFPSYRTCQKLLESLPFLNEVWHSPKQIQTCLEQVWLDYNDHLNGGSPSALFQMSSDLCDESSIPICPGQVTEWLNWFSGPHLRWESIGMLFTFLGMAFHNRPEWDPVFSFPEQQGRNRNTAGIRMRECAAACIRLCDNTNTNDMIVALLKNAWKLQSVLIGDESDDIRSLGGAVIGNVLSAGLHRLPEVDKPTPLSEYRTSLFASIYHRDKAECLFDARPPGFTRQYCKYRLPLDLTDDELFGDDKTFSTAVSKLDSDGWNTGGSINTNTWLRAICLQTPIMEEILEMSVGIDNSFTAEQIDVIIEKLHKVVSSYPPAIQYKNISQWVGKTSYIHPGFELYVVTRVQIDYLQYLFLLERLKLSRNFTDGQKLLNVSQEMMALVLSLWSDRDLLHHFAFTFDWLAVCYGIPAAGVLCVELLKSTKPNYPRLNFLRSEIIQSLTVFISFLDWIRPTDGNYLLCSKLKKVIKRIVERVLDAPPLLQNQQLPAANKVGRADSVQPRVETLWANLYDLNSLDWLDTSDLMLDDWFDFHQQNPMS